ncbi:hypothetical protein [Peribacillus frigoritolerans]|uniref:hypothetical protein n=1 Tax=Peribacillus frigoritolerans TaxID=450367 RepID=UPI000A49DB12|nr:hypothetical protein [Peribacillus frigoritolerans]MCY9141250.1 hypothetical protein [Peribacillus frigoritolerans]
MSFNDFKNGKPEVDIDYTYHGNAKQQPKVSHRHKIINGKRGKWLKLKLGNEDEVSNK